MSNYILFVLLSVLMMGYFNCEGYNSQEKRMKTVMMDNNSKQGKANNLIKEKSPYLQQHAYNPVNWFAWNDEAFKKARAEQKPIFLSIGYSTCHWCHVMEHESFENNQIADLLNTHFISIKVDREERPDIDNVYMSLAQSMNGGGGWPLSVFMTPEKIPFFTGTYFPPEDKYGKVGFRSLLIQISEKWKNDRKNIEAVSDHVREIIKKINRSDGVGKKGSIKKGIINDAVLKKQAQYEPDYGGFSESPKFPTGHVISFLLRQYNLTKTETTLEMATNTLDNMASGGIYDHIGGGFHRYSVDRYWLVPHFEKMLYDQALLIIAYLEAYQITGNENYARVVRETLDYVVRDMTHVNGGFYSAEDADSEGEEGKFYVWTSREIIKLLGKEEGELFCDFYNVKVKGNFEGSTILTARKSKNGYAHKNSISREMLNQRLSKSRKILIGERAKRVRPHLDDKIMTDWNGLMISAFSYAALVLDDSSYSVHAEHAANFILDKLRRKDGRLIKHWRNGQSNHLGLIEDYSFFINGLVDLYSATFKSKYLSVADQLTKDMIRLFWDQDQYGFFFSPNDGEQLISNPKELYDGAIPSGNSVAALALLKLGHIMQKEIYRDYINKLFSTFSVQINRMPQAFPMLLIAYDYEQRMKKEVVIAGNVEDKSTQEFLKKLYSTFNPGISVIIHYSKEKQIEDLIPFVKGQKIINGKVTYYICKNYSCDLPTNDIDQALLMLDLK